VAEAAGGEMTQHNSPGLANGYRREDSQG
jgi:hypothetical protein